MPWKKYNANPLHKRNGDCTIRAISKATGQSWDETYIGIALEGYMLADMPSGNNVWGSYLRKKGFSRHLVPDVFPGVYTVKDFVQDNPNGSYVLALSSHIVAVIDGDYYDTWDSGDEIPIYYWTKGE